MKKIAILNLIILAFAVVAFGQTNKIVVKGQTQLLLRRKPQPSFRPKPHPAKKACATLSTG